jgi:hypothetical protein
MLLDKKGVDPWTVLSYYDRIAAVAHISGDEAQDMCEDLRGYGIEVQTHGDEHAIVKCLVALRILFV